MQRNICSMSAKIKVALISAVLVLALVASSLSADAFSTGTTMGSIHAKSGVYLRATASTKSAKVGSLKNKTRVQIVQEVYVSKNSTKKKKRWYYVTTGAKSGYVRADLVNNISYGNATVSTTAKVNFRKGAGNKMTKKGSFKKGKTLTAVLEARAKDGSIWYKVRKGSGFVYVSGKYLTTGTQQAAAPAPAPQVAAASSGTPAADPAAPLSISANNVRLPENRAAHLPFSVMGTITSNHIMETIEVGVTDSSGNWIIKATQNVNGTVFNLASVDAQLKFGSIPAGTFTYKVNVKVDGIWATPVSKVFELHESDVPDRIAQTALSLAWPIGTPTATFKYDGGSPTAAFQAAINAAYPNRSNWSKAPRLGASCDVFVGTTIRTSGYDPNYPRGWDEQYDYLPNSDKWVRIAYSGDISVLRSGDIVLYKRDSGGCHTCIFVIVNGTPYLAEAQISKYYGYMKSNISKIQKFSDKKALVVYRAAQ